MELPIPASAAGRLAYYKAGVALGVLAPRGWYCFATYGSGGERLMVSPLPIDGNAVLTDRFDGLRGPAVVVDERYGGASDPFISEVITRNFRARRPMRSYPGDRLHHKGNTVVEYRTLPRSEGLGTLTRGIAANDRPIDGVAMLLEHEEPLTLLLLAVRLPCELESLTRTIVAQVEARAAQVNAARK